MFGSQHPPLPPVTNFNQTMSSDSNDVPNNSAPNNSAPNNSAPNNYVPNNYVQDNFASDNKTKSIQKALNEAREYRDQTIKPKKYYYNPQQADTQSVATIRTQNGQQMQFITIPTNNMPANLKALMDAEQPEFAPLTYEEIQVNLRLLGDLIQDEKLHISSDKKTMIVDNRYGQTIMRKVSGDSRSKTLRFVKHVYQETERLCEDIVGLVNENSMPKENTEKLINLYSLLQGSSKGLDRLNMTYSDDKLCSAKIATIKEYFETYCDQTLKKTIDGFRQTDFD